MPNITKEKRLLIVRLDAIGDYVLFRNGLYFLKSCKRFKGFQFTLLGNQLWKNLAEELDREVVDDFFWIDPTMIYNEPAYTLKRLKLYAILKSKGFAVIIHPVHSRILSIDEFISTLCAPVTIGSSGDEINYRSGQKAIADKKYTELIAVPDYSVFEFIRNRDFISGITGIIGNKIHLNIDSKTKPGKEHIFVISPGAGHRRRRWPAESFAELIRLLSSNYPSAFFYICGAHSDKTAAQLILKQSKSIQLVDLCGKLSLIKFAELLQKSTILISNESSAIHLAAAVNIPAVCLSNGNMFGRFNPYPNSMNKKIYTIYADKKFNDPDQFKQNAEHTRVCSLTDISLISAKEVYEACLLVFKTNNSIGKNKFHRLISLPVA